MKSNSGGRAEGSFFKKRENMYCYYLLVRGLLNSKPRVYVGTLPILPIFLIVAISQKNYYVESSLTL